VQFPNSDAVVEVYGIKIAADTGYAEYRVYFVGTNYLKKARIRIFRHLTNNSIFTFHGDIANSVFSSRRFPVFSEH